MKTREESSYGNAVKCDPYAKEKGKQDDEAEHQNSLQDANLKANVVLKVCPAGEIDFREQHRGQPPK